eukprot:CAMPEP_0179910552 /NCGR_PEP_ID=MMETSP0982-20121206/45830_1 /TAXON_ID=483367 /ORGANISM="non described non described, Strain CCMP 2436" /LENGTH=105 /DNA_ID=CAMNT_0021812117 /DNA_START=185 /DNA_END=503 /DNA_ORIENTATION=+
MTWDIVERASDSRRAAAAHGHEDELVEEKRRFFDLLQVEGPHLRRIREQALELRVHLLEAAFDVLEESVLVQLDKLIAEDSVHLVDRRRVCPVGVVHGRELNILA